MDANPFLEKTFYYQTFPTDEWWLKTILIAGAPGMGKTVISNCMAKILKNRYGVNFTAYQTDDLVYFISSVRMDSFITMLVLDDVIKPGIDSRRSMSGDNVGLTQSYYLIRHILEDNCAAYGLPPAGIMILVLIGQDYDRIDKGIRVCADLTIFKSYNPYLEKLTPKIPDEELTFMRDFTEDAKTYNSNEARSYALGKTCGDTYIHFKFPLIKEKIPKHYKPADYLTPEQIKLKEGISVINDTIKNIDIINYNPKALNGRLIEALQQKQLEVPDSILSKLLAVEFYHQWSENQNAEDENDLTFDQKVDLTLKMTDAGIPSRGIAKVFDISHVTVLNWLKKYGQKMQGMKVES